MLELNTLLMPRLDPEYERLITYKTLFYTTVLLLAILVTHLCVMLVRGILEALDWKIVFNNNAVCTDDGINCDIVINENLEPPPPREGVLYSPGMAMYCLDIVARVANMYGTLWTRGFVIPTGTTVAQSLIVYPHSTKPVIGKIILEISTKRAYIIFRGTQTAQEVKADLHIQQKQTTCCTEDHIRAHSGFVDMYNSLKKDIHRFLGAHQDLTEVVVTGHSLGAALAVLCSFDISRSLDKPLLVSTYVFACPRVGNAAFQKAYSPLCFNIMNHADLIPCLPPSVVPGPSRDTVDTYCHVGQVVMFQDNRESLSLNHEIPIYQANITKAITCTGF